MNAAMPRDIHQLRNSPPFGVTAIEGLLHVEAVLQEALHFVPYCDDHHRVWSPAFTRIILDACSQTDSVLKATAKLLDPTTATDRLTIMDHFHRFGSLLSKQRVIFFGGALPCTVCPFDRWQSGYAALSWWDAYNQLKHDRFTHETLATLEYAVHAVAALMLAAIYSGSCDLALISATLLDSAGYNPWAFTNTDFLRDVSCDGHTKVETKLFAHPIGVFGTDDAKLSTYWGSNSARFNIWWALSVKDLMNRNL